MVNCDLVLRALGRLNPGAHVVWSSQVLPRYRKAYFMREALIGVSHRRVTVIARSGSYAGLENESPSMSLSARSRR